MIRKSIIRANMLSRPDRSRKIFNKIKSHYSLQIFKILMNKDREFCKAFNNIANHIAVVLITHTQTIITQQSPRYFRESFLLVTSMFTLEKS